MQTPLEKLQDEKAMLLRHKLELEAVSYKDGSDPHGPIATRLAFNAIDIKNVQAKIDKFWE